MNSRLSAAALPLLLTAASMAVPFQQRQGPLSDSSLDRLRGHVWILNLRANAIPVTAGHTCDPELVAGH